MWAFEVTWTLPYEQPEKLRRRLRIHYPAHVDRLIGLGVPPTLRLQRALRDPPRVSFLDRAVTLAYGSWFVPHVVLFWLLLRHEQYVPRAAGRLAAAYHLTTPFYYLVPTAPPWWASEEAGLMGGEVVRVRRYVLNDLAGKPPQTEDRLRGNPWASMPSDHIASAAITAMGLAEVGPLYGALGWSYVGLATFAVVYLGEHYVLDTLVGLAIAEAIHRGEPAVAPRTLAVAIAQFLEKHLGKQPRLRIDASDGTAAEVGAAVGQRQAKERDRVDRETEDLHHEERSDRAAFVDDAQARGHVNVENRACERAHVQRTDRSEDLHWRCCDRVSHRVTDSTARRSAVTETFLTSPIRPSRA